MGVSKGMHGVHVYIYIHFVSFRRGGERSLRSNCTSDYNSDSYSTLAWHRKWGGNHGVNAHVMINYMHTSNTAMGYANWQLVPLQCESHPSSGHNVYTYVNNVYTYKVQIHI